MRAQTPDPPYYAVVFTSQRHDPHEGDGYAPTSDEMERIASGLPGFLGIESVRGTDGAGITVCYWADEEAIARWRAQIDHVVAQERGRAEWYAWYEVRLARVERAYRFTRPSG